MARAPSLIGVILAAGESTRMGRDKALLPWHGGTFLSAAIHALSLTTDLVVVVAGKNIDTIHPVADANGAFTVENPRPERGQFSSLQIGMQEVLNRGRDAAMVTLVDRPAAEPRTFVQLRNAFADAILNEKWAVVPEFEGQHGHPIVIAREMISAFLAAPDISNAREIEHAHQDRVVYVKVDDSLVIANVNTPEDYSRITEIKLQKGV